MTRLPDEPTRDPELADAWRAFSELLSAADAAAPVDTAKLTPRIARQLAERSRRRRFAVVEMAAAAVLLAAVGFALYSQSGTQVAVQPAVEPGAVAKQEIAVEDVAENAVPAIPAWDDTDIDEQTAALAAELRSTEQQWRQPPDEFGGVEAQINSYEEELWGNTL